MATVKRFEDLVVWQKARALANKIYKLTFIPPIAQDYRYRDQIRGSCGGVMDNIAEGFERGSRLEFVNSLTYAKGEAGELRSQLHRGYDVGYVSLDQYQEFLSDIEEISRSLHRLIDYLNRTVYKGPKFKGREKN